MARIAGVNIPAQKPLHIALRYIFGVGPTNALQICERTGVPATKRVNMGQLSEILPLVWQVKVRQRAFARSFGR